MDLETLLETVAQQYGTDLHLAVGVPPVMRLEGELKVIGKGPQDNLTPEALESLISPYVSQDQLDLVRVGHQDMSVTVRLQAGTFRCHIFREQGNLSSAIRRVPTRLPTLEDLKLPPIFDKLTHTKRGLIVVAGPPSSGKSTTCIAILNHINLTRSLRICTIEDPIHNVIKSKMSLVTQREVGQDVASFEEGIHSIMNSDANMVFLSDLRTLETVHHALMLAETGHLVLACLNAETTSEAVQRMIDVFPEPRDSTRRLLARNLEAVIAQRLVPRKNGYQRIAVHEIMQVNANLRQMITQGNYDFAAELKGNARKGMVTLDDALLDFWKKGVIDTEVARRNMINPENLEAEPKPSQRLEE